MNQNRRELKQEAKEEAAFAGKQAKLMTLIFLIAAALTIGIQYLAGELIDRMDTHGNYLSQTINAGFRYSIPTLGVCAVGKDMERTPRFFKLATRIIAEMGCQMVKTYDCDDFEEVVAACPVPIVVAGGKKLPEKDALHLAYDVIRKGAHGVDMGRNIFQSTHPIEMAQCVNKIVHEGMTDVEAWEMFQDIAK